MDILVLNVVRLGVKYYQIIKHYGYIFKPSIAFIAFWQNTRVDLYLYLYKIIIFLQLQNTLVYCVVGIRKIFTKFLLYSKTFSFHLLTTQIHYFRKRGPNVFYNTTTCSIKYCLQQNEESNASGTCVCASASGARPHVAVPRVVLFIIFHLRYFIFFVATGVAAYNFYLVPLINPASEYFA